MKRMSLILLAASALTVSYADSYGDLPWCSVDRDGHAICDYDSLESCQREIDGTKLEDGSTVNSDIVACIPNPKN